MLRLRWHAAGGAYRVEVTGQYVLVEREAPTFLPTTSATMLGTLIDQRTWTSRQVPNQICSGSTDGVVALSNRAIATDCWQLDGPNAGLYVQPRTRTGSIADELTGIQRSLDLALKPVPA